MKNIIVIFLISISFISFGQEKDIDLKEYFGDLKARHIGPALMSGRINDIELHPTNSKIVYVGAAGGGVWKSKDGGVNFIPIFDKHTQSIGAVAIDPSDPDNTVYVGTGETWTRNSVSIGDGLYRTKDGGSNWEKIGFEKSERIANIIINPKNSKEIYVGVLGALWSDSEDRGVYKSTDGGATWTKVLYIDAKTGCADMTIDPTNPNVLFASMWEFRRQPWSFNSGGDNSALYKSIDGGKTWNKIHNGFPKGKIGRLAIAVAPSNSNILYTVIEAQEDSKKGLYKSEDAGNSWKQLNNDFGITVRPFYFSRIVVDPKNPDVVVKAGLQGSISRDGGKTFKSLGNMHADIHDIAFDINNSDNMYFGTDGGVYRTWNGGDNLEIVKNIPVSQFYHISLDNAEPYNIYGGLQDNGTWFGPSSSDGGINAKDWQCIGYGDGYRALKHPTKNIIYTEMQGADNVWRTNIDKKLVKTIQPLMTQKHDKFRFNWNPPMAISKTNPDRFYMGAQYLFKSEDMGDSWEVISPDLTTNDKTKQDQSASGGLSMDNSGAENHTTIFTIAESPLDGNIVWVGTDDGNVQVTQDGGKTWTNTISNVPSLPKNTWAYHVEASSFNKGTAYVVFEGHSTGDMKPYTYKTTDFGKTWKSIITPEVEGFVRNIQEDFVNPDLLFLGTEFGLYITNNGGKSWHKFTNNMPSIAVHFIDLHPKTNDLVLGTHGRGVIIIDDIAPLRNISNKLLTEKLTFFENAPFKIKDQGLFADSSGNETEFVGQNPYPFFQIKYFLPKRHTFGSMTMEIQDMNGKTLKNIVPGKNKGINIAQWDMTIKQPKTAKGKTFTPSAPLRLKADKYKAVIFKGNDKFEQEFELKYDESIGLSINDREFKNKTLTKMYSMIEELAYMVYELDIILESVKDKKNPYNTFETFKKTLVVTTGDNYVGRPDPQLREDLGSLYSKMAESYDKPSNAELENLKLVESKFTIAKSQFEKLKSKYKVNVNVKSFNEFVAE